ncbi:MAG: Coenzyme F420 hydrogenase/dehydrogenase, beta subunit C-terminal domain [Candidatus Helarchaeota archaeon]|nr:Coenzyme F420 hydrogenase/dehydrogenase, beta subunit C-terminal domain [Candidatus Helarchaeota archaeon]
MFNLLVSYKNQEKEVIIVSNTEDTDDETESYLESFKYAQKRLEAEERKDSFGKLMREIVDSGVCTHCSACVATCDVLIWDPVTDRPKLTGKCSGCGICYNQCPRTITTIPDLIGEFRTIYTARATNSEIKGQDGGIVTAILLYGLESKLFDGAVVTLKSKEEPWKPVPKYVTTKEEILQSSGSIYCHSQTVVPLIGSLRKGAHSIGFVGTPCNINSVYKMQNSPFGLLKLFMRANIFRIGLFCMDSFSYEGLAKFLTDNNLNWSEVEKCLIKKGKFIFLLKNGGEITERVHRLNRYKSSSCYYCTDLTSESADISVGSVGSADGYSTVIIRSAISFELFQDAIDAGYIEATPLERDKLRLVLNLARMKKQSLYTIRSRRKFVYQAPKEVIEKPKYVPATKDDIIKAAARKMAKLSKADVDDNYIRFILINSSGETLDNVNIHIASVQDFFEVASWETSIKVWYPFEELEFEYPRTKDDTEYLIQLNDYKGLIISRVANVKKILEKKQSKKK